MNQSDVDEEVVQFMLRMFQKRLSRFGWVGWLLLAPESSEGYVEQFAKTDERGHLTGEVVKRWHITASDAEELHPEVRIPERVRHGLSCYTFALFAFSLPRESRLGAFNACFGPRRGYGQRFSIKTENESWSIERQGEGWKS